MSAPEGSRARGWRPWVAAALLAGAVWFAVLGQAEDSVFALVPILDEVFYLDRAAAPGDAPPSAPTAHFMSPLYPRLVRVAGADGGVPADRVVPPVELRGLRLLQIACWCGVVALLRVAAGRLLPRDLPRRGLVVWLPSLLAAGYLPGAVYTLTVLVEAPLLLLTIGALVLSLPRRPGEGVGPWAALAAGVCLGAAGLLRGTALVLVPVAALVVATAGPARRGLPAILLVAAAAFVQVPATLHNSRIAGRVAGPTLNGGVNLFIGNGPEANGFYVAVVPGDWRHDPAGRTHLAHETGRDSVGLAEADRIWAERAWRQIRQRPLRAAGLWVKKIWLHLQAWEIDQLTPLDGWRRTVPALRLFAVPWFLVVVLGLAGAADLAARRPAGWWRLLAWATALLAVQSVFFVVTRYRLGLLPFLALLAAPGIVALARRSRPALLAAAAGLLLVVPWGLGDVQSLWRAQALANEAHRRAELGVARADAAEVDRAMDLYRRSLAAGAEGPAPWLGFVALLRGESRPGEALRVATEGVQRLPRNSELRHVTASLHREQGNDAAAARHLTAALAIDPGDAEALHNLVVLATGRGELDRAETLARRLVALRPMDPRSHLDLGVVLASAGDREGAAEAFRRGLETAPGHPDLVENLRRVAGAP